MSGQPTSTIAGMRRAVGWRLRNALELARWLRLSVAADRTAADGYPESFWDFHNGGDWPGFAAVVLEYCAPRSIVDVGCGDGKLLAAALAHDETLDVLGIDSSATALAGASRFGVPVERCDLSFCRPRESKRLAVMVAPFDVAICLETAEHLPPWSGGGLVRALAQGRLVIFSAAYPGQGGTLHMNERDFDYWRRKFAARGYRPAAFDDSFRRAVAALDLPWYYAANIHVFDRAAR